MRGDEQVAALHRLSGLRHQMIGEAEIGIGEGVEIGALAVHPAAARAGHAEAAVEPAHGVAGAVVVEGLGREIDVERGFAIGVAAGGEQLAGVGGAVAAVEIAVKVGVGLRRVAVARALANRPELVLADEPTGNLDEHTADVVLDQFLALVRGEGSAALVATHNERLARRMDRVVRLHEGVLE